MRGLPFHHPASGRDRETANDIAEVNAVAVKNISEATVLALGPPPIVGLGKRRRVYAHAPGQGGRTPQ